MSFTLRGYKPMAFPASLMSPHVALFPTGGPTHQLLPEETLPLSAPHSFRNSPPSIQLAGEAEPMISAATYVISTMPDSQQFSFVFFQMSNQLLSSQA